jgi:hypothetical protein
MYADASYTGGALNLWRLLFPERIGKGGRLFIGKDQEKDFWDDDFTVFRCS